MKLLSELLSSIRKCTIFAVTADSEDEALLLRAGVMPKSSLTKIAGRYPASLVKEAVKQKKLIESPLYLRANPHNRTRPVATQYNIERPHVARLTRNSTTYKVFGKDRLALWYAAANHDLSGSRGEGFGLWLILRFWRLPNIQKLWRRHTERPQFKLPEDAR